MVDGSNLATEGRTLPSLNQLDEAVRAYAEEDPAGIIIVVVDASFEHRIPPDERETLREAMLNGEIVSPPAGAIGRGDAFVLRIAERTGAVVVSNDSFQEFHAEHPWLFDEGRLVGGKPVPAVGWIFTPRLPIRGPKSRQSGKGGSSSAAPAGAAELARAAKRAAKKAPASSANLVAWPLKPSEPPPGPRKVSPVDRALTRAIDDAVAEALDPDSGAPAPAPARARAVTKKKDKEKAKEKAPEAPSAKKKATVKTSGADTAPGATATKKAASTKKRAAKRAATEPGVDAAAVTKATKKAAPAAPASSKKAPDKKPAPQKKAVSQKAVSPKAASQKPGAPKKAVAAAPASPAKTGAPRKSAAKKAPPPKKAATRGDGGATAPSSGDKDRTTSPLPAINEPLAFINFVSAYPVGSTLQGEVVSFTSHGAMVDVALPGDGTLHCYIPLRAMGSPPPTRAREVMKKGEVRTFVLAGLDAARRMAELSLPAPSSRRRAKGPTRAAAGR